MEQQQYVVWLIPQRRRPAARQTFVAFYISLLRQLANKVIYHTVVIDVMITIINCGGMRRRRKEDLCVCVCATQQSEIGTSIHSYRICELHIVKFCSEMHRLLLLLFVEFPHRFCDGAQNFMKTLRIALILFSRSKHFFFKVLFSVSALTICTVCNFYVRVCLILIV